MIIISMITIIDPLVFVNKNWSTDSVELIIYANITVYEILKVQKKK